jgi:hypothetical protein
MTALSAKLLAPFYWLSGTDKQEYHIASWLFIRLIALIYLAAFLSLSVQITGLVGSNGILPVEQMLQGNEQLLGVEARFRIPTLLWFNASDTALLTLCYAGAFFSVLLFLGRFAFFSSISLFILYLSLFHAGQIFLQFQWDTLLLEAGFLTILLVRGYHGIVIFLFHWLLFRLRFLSGLSKLEDPSWVNLTTLNYYFETQPLPHIGAWYFHQLPEYMLRIGTGFTLFVELIVPFFIFLPRGFRQFAAFSTILLQLLIIASSNHNWINLLTIALCLFLLDDSFLSRRLPGSLVRHVEKLRSGIEQAGKTVCKTCYAVIAVIIVITSFITAINFFGRTQVYDIFSWAPRYGLGNVYHIFPTMQTMRFEFEIQGSMDGKHWKTYYFKYKPNDSRHIPDFIIPHQPRLDWMIWFVPTKAARMQPWFFAFLDRLKANSPEVTALLAHNPFPDQAPRYIRVQTYQTRFTDEDEYRKSGKYWESRYLGLYPNVPPRIP